MRPHRRWGDNCSHMHVVQYRKDKYVVVVGADWRWLFWYCWMARSAYDVCERVCYKLRTLHVHTNDSMFFVTDPAIHILFFVLASRWILKQASERKKIIKLYSSKMCNRFLCQRSVLHYSPPLILITCLPLCFTSPWGVSRAYATVDEVCHRFHFSFVFFFLRPNQRFIRARTAQTVCLYRVVLWPSAFFRLSMLCALRRNVNEACQY